MAIVHPLPRMWIGRSANHRLTAYSSLMMIMRKNIYTDIRDKRASVITTTSPYILLWTITKRASGIAVASWPIPQFTSSNNSKLIECDLGDYPNAFQCVLFWFPRRYRSYVPLCIADNYLQLSLHSSYVRTSNTHYLSLTPDGHSIRI